MGKKNFQQPQLTVEELSIALARANEKLRQTERNRRELFANISHDLRSPLTALKSTVEYLATLEEYDRTEMKQLIGVMESRIQMLEALVNDSYLLTTLENEAAPLQYQIVGAGSFLEEFFYSRLADAKYDGRHLVLDVPTEFELLIRIDAVQMERVLDNLFTNALKYSKDGAEITLAARRETDDVLISVRDTGIGMSEETLRHIFERSYQAKQSRTPDVRRGSGLGLAIVKLILDRHSAGITCESTKGEGSCFTIRLPIAKEQTNE